MNERIKEVMDETDSWCDKNFPSDWLNRVDEFLPLWNEKFAELIVRECAKTIESQDVDPSFKNRMSWAIKTKFGIES